MVKDDFTNWAPAGKMYKSDSIMANFEYPCYCCENNACPSSANYPCVICDQNVGHDIHDHRKQDYFVPILRIGETNA